MFVGRINNRSIRNNYLNIRLFRSVISQPNPFFITWTKLMLFLFRGKGVSIITLNNVFQWKIDDQSEWICMKLNKLRDWYFLDLDNWWLAHILLLHTPLIWLLDAKLDRHPTTLTNQHQLNALLITPCPFNHSTQNSIYAALIRPLNA